MNTLINAIQNKTNKTCTENGAVALKSTQKATVDFFGLGGALRNRTNDDIIKLFSKAFFEDELIALRTLFYFRDIRGGQGERKTFRTILGWLGENYPEHVITNFKSIIEFGRWDDIFALVETNLWHSFILPLIKVQWNAEGKATLFWKWMPSNNTSSKQTCVLANNIARYLGITPRNYRKKLSEKREELRVVERDMCANNWSGINYEHVPSRASLLYKKAFIRNDKDRYVQYIQNVENGEAKINAGTLYPYDIVQDCFDGEKDKTLDVLWGALPNYMEGDNSNSIVVADVSGSMSGRPMAVSISLALYISERNRGLFKDYFITFSEKPDLVKVQGNNIREKVANLHNTKWGMNTDLEAVFDAVLEAAKKNNIPQDEMPSTLYIVSDMEFDMACQNPNKTLFKNIKKKYKDSNYEIPTLVFWNVNAANTHVPMKFDDRGVCMVSGCSPAILKTLLAGKMITAEQVMLDTINSERYHKVILP
jgi:hypothetical protein